MAKGWDKFIEDRWDEFFDELVDEIQEQSEKYRSKVMGKSVKKRQEILSFIG